ncbi:3-oxo-5-alpha-steroid 4-dehydrogenase domain-containing protein [Cryptosporidium andersoni]|uniref:3-oxo-5-alpha-steroid 4-dehydrogenase domain-containing protein n=1 Tax=Cryptosporidium andersoni TaxID=117008 RepID=A0A1J4MX59_9CRYT|nr:3-oxo-5-alpha-steroid 4-dehydrogenase domain-containing protein [Cryptosporidium andersoni]
MTRDLARLSILQFLTTMYFALCFLATLFSCFSSSLHILSQHGKLIKNDLDIRKFYNEVPRDIVLVKLLKRLYALQFVLVRKSLFKYFYIVGIFACLGFMFIQDNTSNRMIMFTIHVLRRFLEEIFIAKHNSNKSSMSLVTFLFGISYYIMMPIAINLTWKSTSSPCLIQIAIFFLFSALQFMSHRTLSNIRRHSRMYDIPCGGLFNWISCPHYLCEIGIYTSLFADIFVYGIHYLWIYFAMMYITTCMIVNAIRSHKWYIETFRESYIKLNRKAIVPLVI